MITLFETQTLSVTLSGHVGTLTLTRPDALNPVDTALHKDLYQALDTIDDVEDLRALVFASTGRVFSAGGDIKYFRQANGDVELQIEAIEVGRRLINKYLDFPVPVVAALHGAALGLGANLVALSDAVVAARGTYLSDPHVRMGIVAGDSGCLAWPQAVGMLRARRHLLTGDPMSAEDGYQFGLVTDLVDTPEAVLPAAVEIAERIASLPPLAVRGTKQALNRVTQQRAGEVLELGLMLEARTIGTQDMLEAVDAFTGRRSGRFHGR